LQRWVNLASNKPGDFTSYKAEEQIKRSNAGRGGKIRVWDGERMKLEAGPKWGRIGPNWDEIIINHD